MTDFPTSANSITEDRRRRLQELHRGLMHLHKALLDTETAMYEQLFGRIASRGALLQLVIGDPWFAWLRTISERVIAIDILLDAKDPVATNQDADTLLSQIRALLTPTETGEGFGRRYYDALQRDPNSVLAHGQVSRLLGPASPPEE